MGAPFTDICRTLAFKLHILANKSSMTSGPIELLLSALKWAKLGRLRGSYVPSANSSSVSIGTDQRFSAPRLQLPRICNPLRRTTLVNMNSGREITKILANDCDHPSKVENDALANVSGATLMAILARSRRLGRGLPGRKPVGIQCISHLWRAKESCMKHVYGTI
jgi:hypothetical protein